MNGEKGSTAGVFVLLIIMLSLIGFIIYIPIHFIIKFW